MKHSIVAKLIVVAGFLYLGSAAAQPLRPTADDSLAASACQAINELRLPELIRIEAQWIPAGPPAADLMLPGGADARMLPSHCRARGTVDPSIRFEVWLPGTADWNGRFLGIGSGPNGLSYLPMLDALDQGYASAVTDTGHPAGSYDWLGDASLLRDFAYRAVYEMTAKADAIIAAFYGRTAEFRYFNGCSVGGSQGLMAAERFPDDYDGIVAGDPVNAFIAARTTELWMSQAAQDIGGQSLLGPATLALVNDTAIEQCDALDGVLDGVLEDPRRCGFNPARLQCGVGGGSMCLSSSQVTAIQQIYSGPLVALDGSRSLPGLAIGSERGWSFAASGTPSVLTLEFFRRSVFDDPGWNWRNFDYGVDFAYAEAELGWMLDATVGDLAAFRDRGGKLILYQGWNDVAVSPEAVIAYYESVESGLAGQLNAQSIATSEFARLFMVPGMGHCGGGTGTDQFDAQRAIEDWVERGIEPARIEASRIEGDEVVRTRPLCPYPQLARYRGTGNSDRSGSFVCEL